jgi:signal transduction histidine kinase
MNSALHALLLDDNPDDRALVIRELRHEFPDLQVEQVTESKGFAPALEAGGFDLAITDYQLRWTDGLQVLRAIKAHYPNCPVIMFTANGSEEIAVEAMQAGLDGYVLKSPQHYVRLLATVQSALERAQQRQVMKEIEKQVQHQEQLAAIGQLAGGIAHDFNNILATILLYAQTLLSNRHLPPDLTPGLEAIISEARQANQLVRQILDFSHLSKIETSYMDLVPCIREIAEILQRTLPENIHLLLQIGPEEHIVNADPNRIQQALMNLALNARDAMPQGGELRIGLARFELRPGDKLPVADMSAGEWVCLSVSDTGTGIPPEVKAHLFEPFFTTKPKGERKGLGLAQVYGIVKQHDGHIEVETLAGQGTTFRVYVPASEAAKVKGTPQERKKTLDTPEGKGETILLVENENNMRELTREILVLLGYRVLTAANGQEALEVYRSAGGVDLVMTDMAMPEMGGKDLVRELRKLNPALKAVATTGLAVEDMRDLQTEGILAVIEKPFDKHTLAQVIRRVLDAE